MRSIKVKGMQKRSEEEISIPSNIFITSGESKGNIKLLWEPVKNIYSYAIQKSVYRKDKLRWKYVDITDRSNYIVTGLKSGITYCFRIAAITAKGQGTWSKFVEKTAP